LGQTKVSIPFTSIAWSTLGTEDKNPNPMEYGVICGGHKDGTITIWDVSQILNDESQKVNNGLIQSKKLHSSQVNTLSFNLKPNLFASGSDEIKLISIDKNYNMESVLVCPSQNEGGYYTSFSWNDKVPHILAAANSNGYVYVWEMKKTQLCLKIYDQQIEQEDYPNIDTNIVWANGVELTLAYDHPEFNFISQYDMRQPNAPSAEYHGVHSRSIISLSRNNIDNHFLLSLGRDNIVTCWSMRTVNLK
jgi:WD40 repeat protein